ncbi:NAD(P)H oxidoreductase [Escherichia coli]
MRSISGQWSGKIQVTELDLYRRNFNPVMTPEDEPDWKNMDKRYSPEVHQLYSELLEHDTLVVVFPLWWYSFPAMLKGYIDRVWNNGLAYGDGHKLPFNKVRWVALVGGDKRIICPDGLGKKYKRLFKKICAVILVLKMPMSLSCVIQWYSMGKNFTRAIISRYYLRYGIW